MRRSSQATVLALVAASDAFPGMSRHHLVGVLETLGSTEPFTRSMPTGLEPVERETLDVLRTSLSSSAIEEKKDLLAGLALEHPEISLVTVLDDTYPFNLRQIYDKPPFLFCRGSLGAAAERAIAVVGTRRPSPAGIDQARRIAAGLATAGITVVSGLALGIDTAAHEATLDAGGTTVAVLGHGILHSVYPAANRALAERIAGSGGLLVSQFWPTQSPTRVSFPIRNVTTSGLSLGTVVIEAAETSGARQQARKCLEHGKQLFLLRSLVHTHEWARRYSERPGVVTVDDVGEVLARLDALVPRDLPVQLAFG